MDELHPPAAHGTAVPHGPPVRTYLVIFVALVVFTASSFFANLLAHPEVALITRTTSFVIILGVAVCKAVLVAMYFMHLKFEWGKLYFLVVPVMILTVMMMIVLLPDFVLAPHHATPAGTGISSPGHR